jgi:hypothetical protein
MGLRKKLLGEVLELSHHRDATDMAPKPPLPAADPIAPAPPDTSDPDAELDQKEVGELTDEDKQKLIAEWSKELAAQPAEETQPNEE